MPNDNVGKFIEELRQSLKQKTFVRLTLGNYRGDDPNLQKIVARLIEVKTGIKLSLLTRHNIRDLIKNYSLDEGIDEIAALLGTEFFSGHLFTTKNDYQLEIGKKSARLNIAKPTFKKLPPLTHDRSKKAQIDKGNCYLRMLGITNEKGEVRDRQQDKWRQINKFVEILAKLVDNSALKNAKQFRVVDMGSGKGYLTFAAFDYFRNIRGLDVKMTGVERRPDLVSFCNDVAGTIEFDGLDFVEGDIDGYSLTDTDILIALHACNTATDEAIFKGIRAGASLIVCSPCCHQEIRPQMKSPGLLKEVLKHGILLDREAETITDGLRAMLLERSGYSTKVFEFVAVEHTPKNNMIVGTKGGKVAAISDTDGRIREIMDFYGIKEQKLAKLLKVI